MVLYHGSDKIISKPLFGIGKPDNDYGSGFYTTQDLYKAKEWAWANGDEKSAYCNIYKFNDAGLNIVNLDKYGPLAWIAEIIYNRGLDDEVAMILGEKIVQQYRIDTSQADVIIGYRADGSYMQIVDAFLKNQLSIDEVERQFKQGELGLQIFIKSPGAFERIEFIRADKVEFDKSFGEAERYARHSVYKFLRQREAAILTNNFSPSGLTAKDVINNTYKYHADYNYYYPVEETQNQEERDYD